MPLFPFQNCSNASFLFGNCSNVLQGLVDAHVHIMAGGLTLQRVDLRAVDSKYGFAAAVKTAVGMCGPHGTT